MQRLLTLIASTLFFSSLAAYKVAILGTGYVGLVTAAGLAEIGHEVTGVDIDLSKIATLNAGQVSIYEPGLDLLIAKHRANHRLHFSTDVGGAIEAADLVFIAVGTPMSDSGAADLSAVFAATQTIGQHLNRFKVLCIKSTVPVGTSEQVKNLLEASCSNTLFSIVSNPEFLREGSAIHDFLAPDRIVVGCDSKESQAIMYDLYKPLIDQGTILLETDNVTAESIKYAANAFLAVKISFINELAKLSDRTGADIDKIAEGMGLDRRINPHFLKAGPGFGGSCFPKDSNALLYMANQHGVELRLVKESLEVNKLQRAYVTEKIASLLQGSFEGRTIAVLGIAFKANTGDTRESPALDVIERLVAGGAFVKAYDPVATFSPELFGDAVNLVESMDDALADADAVVILTEWDEFKKIDLARAGTLLRSKILIDARNLLEPAALKAHGFAFENIGRMKS